MEVLQNDINIAQVEIDEFFSHYAARFNKALKEEKSEVDETANAFAKCFIEATPKGVMCGGNDAQFRKMIQQGYAFYRSIGLTYMEIMSKEITVLDTWHSLVKGHWRASFVKVDSSLGELEFDVFYLLQKITKTYRIVAYITGDEQKALKENELI